MTPSFSAPSVSLGSALPAAAMWLEAVLLGNVAISIALLGVAAVGFLMLQGRLPVVRGLRVVIGCFIIFGAGGIAAGLMGLAQSSRQSVETINIPPPRLAPVAPPRPPTNADPYAGASVPM